MRSRALRRVSWGLADQVVASLTNFALTVSVAREVAPASFGVFAILLVATQLVIVVSRGVTTDPLIVHHSSDEAAALKPVMKGALSGALLTGTAAMLVVAAIAGVIPAGRDVVLAFALVLPGLTLQDAVRYCSFGAGRPRIALLNDLLWAALQLGGVATAVAAGHASVPVLTLIWGGSGAVCALVGLVQLRSGIRPRTGWSWIREHWRDSRYLAAENAALNGTNLVTISLIGVVAGFESTAALRGAVALFGPVIVFSLGARAALTPELVRVANRDRDRLFRAAILTSMGFAAVGIIWSLLIVVLAPYIGVQLLGPTWEVTEPILRYALIDPTAAMFIAGVFVGIRASGDPRRGFHTRIGLLLPRIGVAVTGAAVAGAQGAAIGLALLAPVTVAVWAVQLRSACRQTTIQRHSTSHAEEAGAALLNANRQDHNGPHRS